MTGTALLQQVVLAFALGALVGLERERSPGKKYAGLRTLSLFCGAGPLSVAVAERAGSILPVAIYLLLGAAFAFAVLHLRMRSDQQELGLTTSSTVFLLGLVGVLVGYQEHFVAVAITLIAVFLLAEKQMLHRYANMLTPDEISDAVAVGILALVLYPILPEGAVDPWGVLFLRQALLFVIFILLVQFAAFVALKRWESNMGFLASAGLGGIVSSLAVVSTLTEMASRADRPGEVYAAAMAANVTMLARNLAIAAVIAPAALPVLAVPFAVAIGVGVLAALLFARRAADAPTLPHARESPLSFRRAFRFGVMFLAILMLAEVASQQFAAAGLYASAFIGGVASSTAVVASAAALLTSGTVPAAEAAAMVAIGTAASILTKPVFTAYGRSWDLTRAILPPSVAMVMGVLLVLL